MPSRTVTTTDHPGPGINHAVSRGLWRKNGLRDVLAPSGQQGRFKGTINLRTQEQMTPWRVNVQIQRPERKNRPFQF